MQLHAQNHKSCKESYTCIAIVAAMTREKRLFGLSCVILSFLIIEILLSIILRSLNLLANNSDSFSWLLIILHSGLLLVWIVNYIQRDDREIISLLFLSLLSRTIYVAYLVYISEVELYSDMLTYQTNAVNFFVHGFQVRYITASSIAMGTFYKLFGVQRVLLQHFHSMLIIIAGLIVYSLLKKLHVSKKYYVLAVLWTQFSPKIFMDSCNIHREAIICFFVAASLACFVRFVLKCNLKSGLLALLLSFIGASFHAGVIGISVGYMISMVLYSPEQRKFSFTYRKFILLIFLLLLFAVLYFGAFNFFFAKFNGLTFEGMINSSERAEGGAYYSIGSGRVRNFWDAILYTPLRTLYFYCSPMPWDWRGLLDSAAFFLSGALYGCTFILAFKNLKCSGLNGDIIKMLLLALLLAGIIFGWGTKNAGTAIRHRDKFISIAAFVTALCLDINKKGGQK